MKAINYMITIALLISAQMANSQELKVDTKKSVIKWTGKKIGGSHYGEIKLKSGSMELKGDKITSGTFVVDMNSITNEDLKDEDTNQKLVGHLKSDDFFGVKTYPTSMLTITNSTAFNNGKATVTGEFTIKDKTEKITFEVSKSKDSYVTMIEIDRSKFDVRYGSKSFFNDLGNRAIDDIFTLEVKLVAS